MSNQIPRALLTSAETTIRWGMENNTVEIDNLMPKMREEMSKNDIKEASDQLIIDALRKKAGEIGHTITVK